MTIDKEQIEKLAIKAIEEHNIVFINDLCSYLPISRSTFYEYNLDKSDSIKESLEANRVSMKADLRKKWFNSTNSTAQIVLYKLLATTEERNAISNKVEIKQSTSQEEIQEAYLNFMKNLTPSSKHLD